MKQEINKSVAFWLTRIQNELFRQLRSFMEKNELNQDDLAEKFNVSKGHISQILKGDSNFTLKKLITLALNIGKIPILKFVSFDKFSRYEHDIDDYFDSINSATSTELKNVGTVSTNSMPRKNFNESDFSPPTGSPIVWTSSLSLH